MAQAQKKKPADKKPDAETTEEAVVEMPKAPALTMPRFGLAEEHRNIWRVTVPIGTIPEQVMDEAFWSNVSRLLQPGDEIQVLPDNYAWRRDLFVTASGTNWAQVQVLDHYDLSQAEARAGIPSRYKAEFAGAHHKWRVLRDGEPLKDGFASEKLARQWAANHEAAVNR
jgi:hypothetical protein